MVKRYRPAYALEGTKPSIAKQQSQIMINLLKHLSITMTSFYGVEFDGLID
jgi:hypothetical protein